LLFLVHPLAEILKFRRLAEVLIVQFRNLGFQIGDLLRRGLFSLRRLDALLGEPFPIITGCGILILTDLVSLIRGFSFIFNNPWRNSPYLYELFKTYLSGGAKVKKNLIGY
jgi:hypothetical protein